MSLDRAVAVVAAHLGVINEDEINNMSYVFFEDVLRELGYRLNYEAVVNYAGNSFCEKSWKMISESNPFSIDVESDNSGNGNGESALAQFFGNVKIKKKDG